MAIEKIAKGIKSVLTDRWGDLRESIVWTAVLGGLAAGGYGGVQWSYEDWDNVVNQNTAQVTQEFNQRASNINYLAKKLEFLEAGYKQSELKSGGVLSAESPEFQKFAIDKMVLEEKLTGKTQQYVTDVLLNTDLTEDGAKQIMTRYKNNGLEKYGPNFPKTKFTYALKETQAEFNAQAGLTAEYKAEQITKSLNSNELDELGVLMAIPGAALALFGIAGLAAGANRVENYTKRRRKKPALKKN